MSTVQIAKRDLSSALDVSASASVGKARTVYPVVDALGSVTPKDYLSVYDGDYRQAGLAYLLDVADALRLPLHTESEINTMMRAYAHEHTRIADDGTRRIDLPLYIGASQIVYAIAQGKPMSGIALYGLAWSARKWATIHVERMRAILHTAARKSGKVGAV